jgi:hypothetical protein
MAKAQSSANRNRGHWDSCSRVLFPAPESSVAFSTPYQPWSPRLVVCTQEHASFGQYHSCKRMQVPDSDVCRHSCSLSLSSYHGGIRVGTPDQRGPVYVSVSRAGLSRLSWFLSCPSLQVSSKTTALVGAALLLLDFTSTVVVSAATAASYIAGEVTLPMPQWTVTILIIVLFLLVAMLGMQEGSRSSLIILAFHVSGFRAHTSSFPNSNFTSLSHYAHLSCPELCTGAGRETNNYATTGEPRRPALPISSLAKSLMVSVSECLV